MSGLIMYYIKSAYAVCISPRSQNEDDRRREFVLNTLLCISICLVCILNIVVIHHSIVLGEQYAGVPFELFSLLCLLYISLLILSRKGHYKIAVGGILTLYVLGTSYTAITWGFDTPSVVVGCLLVIAIASILIHTKAGVIVVVMLCVGIVSLAYHQIVESYPIYSWRNSIPNMHDAFFYVSILLFITFLYWLSNRQIEYSLARARASEAELQIEKDQLEVKVEERTKEIKLLQMERVAELYQFAEFGKISIGAFHDLINPLSSIHLITSEMNDSDHSQLPEFKQHISLAVQASRKMQNFIDALRKKMRSGNGDIYFDPHEEINETLLLFSYKIKKAGCTVQLTYTTPCHLFGNPITFYQIIANLVSNSVDAYEHMQTTNKNIDVVFGKKSNNFVLEITDYGCGISAEALPHIFDSFFTTKPVGKGSGIGLSTVRHIVEKDFNGSIIVQSTRNKQTTFTITIPLHEHIQTHHQSMHTDNQEPSVS